MVPQTRICWPFRCSPEAAVLLAAMMMIMLVGGPDASPANYVGNGTDRLCLREFESQMLNYHRHYYPQGLVMNWCFNDSKHFFNSHGVSCDSPHYSALQGMANASMNILNKDEKCLGRQNRKARTCRDSIAEVVLPKEKSTVDNEIGSENRDILMKPFEEKAAAANQCSRTDMMMTIGLEEQAISRAPTCLRHHQTRRSNNYSDRCPAADREVINGSIMNNVFSNTSCSPRILLKKEQVQILEWNSTAICRREKRNVRR